MVSHSMASDTRPQSPPGPSNTEVMASVDSDGCHDRYVIADISEDGAWLSVAVDDAPAVTDWR